MVFERDLGFYNKIHNILDVGNKKGLTNYIDFIKEKELTHNLMKGVDIFNRKFITLKVGILNINTNKLIRLNQVFFQRYSDDINGWMSATIENQCEIMYSYGGIREEQYKLLNDLVDGKTLIIEDYHRISSPNLNGSIIASMDAWENKYAKVLQKNFFISRYHPKYKFCRNVLNRQYDFYVNGINKQIIKY